MTKSSVLAALLGVALLAAAAPARADIILLTGTDVSGQGLGSSLTVLTLQSPRNSTSESGGVNFDGSVFGDTQPGALKNRTFTLADLGIASAGQLALLLDLSEPSSEKPPSVTVTSPFALTLTVYDATGASHEDFAYSCGATANPCRLDQVAPGLGGSELAFGLDTLQQAVLNDFIGSHLGAEVFAVSASFGDAQGGPEVIRVGGLKSTAPAATRIPEPAGMLLLGSGLLGAGLFARKKMKG